MGPSPESCACCPVLTVRRGLAPDCRRYRDHDAGRTERRKLLVVTVAAERLMESVIGRRFFSNSGGDMRITLMSSAALTIGLTLGRLRGPQAADDQSL